MKLTESELQNKTPWEKADVQLPLFDRKKVIENTFMNPAWVHFGAGNIFRAFPAAIHQKLLNAGLESTGIVVVEGYDYEIIDNLFLAHDNLSLLVTLKADGNIEKTVIASMVEALKADCDSPDFDRLIDIFRNPSLQMVSFTITEKGYSLVQSSGDYLPDVAEDFVKGPATPGSYIGKLAALMYQRYLAGSLPVALVSMDNCSHNGTRLYEAVHAFASKWSEAGLTDQGFASYIADPKAVSFPWSMIDKITPRPDDDVKAMLTECGFEGAEGKVTAKNTYIAPFVNAEQAQYLVIEDAFPNGRPKLEKAGVIFTDRKTVDKVEKMKVCTCLNPLHTALAVFGCLLSYTKISAEMKDTDLKKLVERLGYKEGLPVVVDPGIINPRQFIDEVLNIRFPNPFMPDTPQRIATDTSQKLSIRFGETIKAYQADDKLDTRDLKAVALVLAGWCRYLMGVNDEGAPFSVSPDPMYNSVFPHLSGIKLGQTGSFAEQLKPILSDARIFGVNLYDAGLAETVESMFAEMVSGPGAVRATLRKYLA